MDCPYYGFPGCKNPHDTYEDELRAKQEELSLLYGEDVSLTKNPSPTHYRNRVDYACTPTAQGLRRGGPADVVDLEECPIANDTLNRAWKDVRAWIADEDVPCYDLETREGWLRYAVLRGVDKAMVVLTTATTDNEDLVEKLWGRLDAQSLVWTVNQTRTDTSVGDTHRVFGEDTITIPVADKRFLVGPDTFFQASTAAFEKALEAMKQHVPSGARILDLYCGVGTISLSLSQDVVGVEEDAAAIALAKQNAQRLHARATFINADAAEHLQEQPYDVVVVDPPRTGLKTAVHALLAGAPKRILYLSCNPATQRRDIAALKTRYELEHIEGFDFFTRTDHVESLAVLERKE